MSDRLIVSTRKGLFGVERQRCQWRIAKAGFLGDNITLTSTAGVADRRIAR
jgi:hypothetical protein